MTLTTETWLPVPGYEGLYEVSDLGRVRGRALAPKQGSTRTWLPGAPDVDLDELAATHGLR